MFRWRGAFRQTSGLTQTMQQAQPDTLTLCALSAMAFIVACAGHEAAGHGLACLGSGGSIALLTSVYFRCHPGMPLVDAAGPAMNLVVAAACAIALGRSLHKPTFQAFLALLLAFSGLWSAGYFVCSAVADTGDLAFVLRDLSLKPRWLWRVCMGIAGIALYRTILARATRFSPKGLPLRVAYAAAVAVACISVLFYRGPTLPALGDAALESCVAPLGLLLVAGRQPSSNEPTAPVSRAIVAGALAAIALFWFTMGRGIYGV